MSRLRTAAFIGTMNAMPMAYALELKSLGWQVSYFVDVPLGDKLSRPEYKFPNVQYPYPDWVIERPVKSQFLAAVGPRFILWDILRVLRRADVVFLSGLFLPLAAFLKPSQKKIFLSYGSDLDAWCDVDSVPGLAGLFADRIGPRLARFLVGLTVKRMIAALKSVDAAVTFPAGLSTPGDRVFARELQGGNMRRIARYDISFADLPTAESIRVAQPSPTMKIICGTRHTFKDHPGLTERENKGTDIIIRGLAGYARVAARRLEIHFFEKGLDLQEAKDLCCREGIDAMVIWHKEMPFQEFLQLHQTCHIAFDQVGTHWVGSGMYAMYLGLPLIANSRREVFDRYWGEPSPVCHAATEADIVRWLTVLEDDVARTEIGDRSRQFALTHFGCAGTTRRIVAFLDSMRGSLASSNGSAVT